MKKVVGLILAIAFIAFASSSFANQIAEISKRLPADMYQEVSQIPAKPHFLLGLEHKTDEWEQYLEWQKIFQTKDLFYAHNESGIIDKSRPDYRAVSNTEIIEVINVSGKDIKIVYTHHRFTRDGMHVFWSRMGEKNLAEFSPFYPKYKIQWGNGKISDKEWQDIQRAMGYAQFEAVKNFLHEAVRWALARNLKDYSDMNLTAGVLEARSRILDDPNYSARLDDPVPGTKNLKVRDILPVPLTRAEDFLPDVIITGPAGFYGGMANYKTPGTERFVFFDLLGLALWYVSDWPMPAHEFVHTNPYLQGTPLDLYYDLEMAADLTTGLDAGMQIFLFHSYQALTRYLARTFFGYDYEEAIRRIFPGEFVVQDIREREFREHATRVKKITREILRFVKDPQDGYMVRFYTDPYFWVTVNTKLCDKSASFAILFSLRYEPAGIFDPERKDKDGKMVPPAQQTREWLMKEDEGGKLKALAEEAMEKTGEKTKLGNEMSKSEDLSGLIKCPVDSSWFLMTREEQNKAKEFLEPIIKKAREGDFGAQLVLQRIFGGQGVLQKFPR